MRHWKIDPLNLRMWSSPGGCQTGEMEEADVVLSLYRLSDGGLALAGAGRPNDFGHLWVEIAASTAVELAKFCDRQ